MVNGKTINLMNSKMLPIAGDASFRKFYRVILKKKSKIVVIAKKDKYKNLIAYTAVNKFLIKNKILAPKTLRTNFSKGEIVIEDFGDLSLYKVLLKEKNKFKNYKKIVDLLLKIQKIKPKKKIESIINKSHIVEDYSSNYLNREINLFFEWYLPLILNKKKTLDIKKKIKKIFIQLYKRINFPNKYFVHRDYHVQNLMLVGKKVGIIDSQDALIGNPAYDLASLIDDVRIKTSKKLKVKIYNYYIKNFFSGDKRKIKNFLQDFNILSVQRLLKIIGIFSRLSSRDKKNKYLKLIPYTWQLLEMRINSKLFFDLKRVLDKNIPQKIRKKIIYR
jgi:N-acetylmuramate 1-kinase